MSWLQFSTLEDSDIAGAFTWVKPPVARSRYYPAGFTLEGAAVGSVYLKPITTADHALGSAAGVAHFSQGNLVSPVENAISFGLRDKVTNLSSNKLTLKVIPATGLFSGTVLDPNSRKLFSFNGVILQKHGAGYGLLAGTNLVGRVELRPE
jgi:hypothetical protein